MSEDESSDPGKQLNAVFGTAVDGVITVDSRGVIRSFNSEAERIFGYTAREVIGKNVSLLAPEPDRSRHDDYVRRYLATGERRIIGIGREVEGLRKDGTRVPIELEVDLQLVEGEEAPHFVAFVRDLTRRKEVEANLQTSRVNLRDMATARNAQFEASELGFHDLFEFSPDALVTSNEQGAITLVNQQAERLFGWTRAELVGQPVEVLVPRHQREGHPALRQRYLQNPVARPMGTILNAVRKDGSEFPVEVSLSPVDTGGAAGSSWQPCAT